MIEASGYIAAIIAMLVGAWIVLKISSKEQKKPAH